MNAILAIRVTPRSSRPGIGDWKTDPDGRPFLEVRVSAAPADGAANAELVSLLAKRLGIAKGSIQLVSGQTARLKRLRVQLSEEELRGRLGG